MLYEQARRGYSRLTGDPEVICQLDSPHLLISEIRAIAADELWLSPCCEQPCVTIHVTWKQDWPAVRKLLPVIGKELVPFRARPHWGKLFTTSPAELKDIYSPSHHSPVIFVGSSTKWAYLVMTTIGVNA